MGSTCAQLPSPLEAVLIGTVVYHACSSHLLTQHCVLRPLLPSAAAPAGFTAVIIQGPDVSQCRAALNLEHQPKCPDKFNILDSGSVYRHKLAGGDRQPLWIDCSPCWTLCLQ